jgi:hypothetical protein
MRQRGYTTLGIGLILIASLTLVILYATRVSILEQRIAANEARQAQAFAAAEAALEQGFAYLQRNRGLIGATATGGWMQSGSPRWTLCATSEIAPPCGNGQQNLYGTAWLAYRNVGATGHLRALVDGSGNSLGSWQLHYLTQSVGGAPASEPVITVVAEGWSVGVDDNDTTRATATLRQDIFFYPFTVAEPGAPMLAAGNIGASGNFSVVGNPNGGGPGVPLSAWSNGNVSLAGTSATCTLEDFLLSSAAQTTIVDSRGQELVVCPGCVCPNVNSLSNATIENYDILDNDGDIGINPDTTNFPPDVFEYMFGVPAADYRLIKQQATIIANCSALNANSAGLYWVTGNCDTSTHVGSFGAPVAIISEGEVKITGSYSVFGLIFAFDVTQATSGSCSGNKSVHLAGGVTLYGAISSNCAIDMGNGNYTQRFDSTTLNNISLSATGRGTGKIPGSWSDAL